VSLSAIWLLVTNVDDLVALHAAGGLHLDGLARFLADPRAMGELTEILPSLMSG